MAADKFRISFPSDKRKVQEVVQEILVFVKNSAEGYDHDSISDLRLVFSELLFNAVIHGNRQDFDKSVYVEVEITAGEVLAVIEDEGVGFDHSALLVQATDLSDVLLNENGRGIKLAATLTDYIAFNGCGNRIRFKKKVTDHG